MLEPRLSEALNPLVSTASGVAGDHNPVSGLLIDVVAGRQSAPLAHGQRPVDFIRSQPEGRGHRVEVVLLLRGDDAVLKGHRSHGPQIADMEFVNLLAAKAEILDRYEALAAKVQDQYDNGLITNPERRQELIEIWTRATNEVDAEMRKAFPKYNTVQTMVGSGARGNWMQVRQIAGMRGLVSNPKGEIIPRPIKSNYREGLSVLEYFIATHGARKGLADTALRTADSGYLTRRLVDVSQDVIVREQDCYAARGEAPKGMILTEIKDGNKLIEPLKARVVGRYAVEPIKHPETGEVIVAADEMVSYEKADLI